jgi:glucose/arabinose dehydrogenase
MEESSPTRRQALAIGLAVGTGLAGCQRSGQANQGGNTDSQDDDDDETETTDSTDSTDQSGSLNDLGLAARQVASGLASPVGIAGTDTGPRYIVDQVGEIRRLTDDGLAERPVLDVRDRMAESLGREMGLLGLALHPDFEDNGRAFVRYSGPPGGETPSGYSHSFVLSEFRADEDRTTFDPDSERVLLRIPEPQSNHNAGSVTFGPDGYLYVGVGDGGGAGDQGRGHVDDWDDTVAGGNGQDVTQNLLGSVLRIDVDSSGDDERRPYAVPDDNPLVDRPGLDEQYAWGLRNPWRFSFGPDGRFFVADVGQSNWEEIDLVERGGNYGWNVREGPDCFRASACPTETNDGEPLRDPIVAYPHNGADVSGISVIGGYVYEGEMIPALAGRYVFGDYRANGQLFVASEGEDDDWSTVTVPIEGIGSLLTSFGRDVDGELLVCTTDGGGPDTRDGAVYRIVAA